MLSYENLKKWCLENKKEITVGVCFLLIFFVGFGTGRYDKEVQSAKRKSQNNYSKSVVSQQKEGIPLRQDFGGQVGEQSAADANCVIKGNINSQGKMIYHISTGAFYAQTKPEKCFNTEEEAKKAGFVKSSR